MPRAFAAITFTDSVKAAQTRYHSRDSNRGFELADDTRSEMTEREAEFIAAPTAIGILDIQEVLERGPDPEIIGIAHVTKRIGGVNCLAWVN